MLPRRPDRLAIIVTPAKAGVQAGRDLDESGREGEKEEVWIPAFDGMTKATVARAF